MSTSNDSLCWTCAKACGGWDCQWANESEPVPGWIVKQNKNPTRLGYNVQACPKYVRGRNADILYGYCAKKHKKESSEPLNGIDKIIAFCESDINP